MQYFAQSKADLYVPSRPTCKPFVGGSIALVLASVDVRDEGV